MSNLDGVNTQMEKKENQIRGLEGQVNPLVDQLSFVDVSISSTSRPWTACRYS